MTGNYYASGKLMISGEYLVLYGATALVLPLRLGQHMKVTATGSTPIPLLRWRAKILSEPWFSADIEISGFTLKRTTNVDLASRIIPLMAEVDKMNPSLFSSEEGFEIETNNGFDLKWGFGSSSALIANLSQWAGIDAFELYFRTSNGSGADIAAAMSDAPVIYKLADKKPEFYRIGFKPSFHDKLWFVYLGTKQDSARSVSEFRNSNHVTPKQIRLVDDLTYAMLQAEDLDSFSEVIFEHERILGRILEKDPIKNTLFSDFKGEVKSLGAWGGDFVLAASGEEEETVRNYFMNKGFHTMFSFDEIVL